MNLCALVVKWLLQGQQAIQVSWHAKQHALGTHVSAKAAAVAVCSSGQFNNTLPVQ
jgi:hypothetical protein